MAPGTKKHKIVVVEDEGLIAADLEARLKAAGYAVPGTADCATQALQLIQETSPDLVLMDIRLKGELDGIQVAGQIRQQHDIPVVYLTAYEDRGTLERASHTQAFGYIKKPIASSSLQGSIEMALAKHRHERELRAQRDWLAASFSAVPSAVLVTDSSGRICYLNSLAEELTGWRADDALGHPARELLRLVYRQTGNAVEDFVSVAMLQGETVPLPGDVWLKGGEGRSFAVQGSVSPRWRDGRVEGAVIALADTTLCQFEEEQARQDGKQEALLRMADEIVRELPELGAMSEDCKRLLEALPQDSPARQDAESITRAATDAFAVTYRLRKYLEVPEPRLGHVAVQSLLARLEAAWQRLKPRLTLDLKPDSPPVQADEWQLTKALLGILRHACRQMDGQSALTIELSTAVLEQMSHSVRIRVTYTTSEEDATSLERAFEPSWSRESPDLPLAYRGVKKMGGLLTARLEPGSTVAFDFYLSRADAAAAGVPLPEPKKPAALLIESNSEVRRVLQLHFERHGYHVLEAADCEEGLLLASLYPALIPIVIANPENDDRARSNLAEKLRAIRPESQVRVLAGYYESCRIAASGGIEMIGTRHLTKWDLLAWVTNAFASEKMQDLSV